MLDIAVATAAGRYPDASRRMQDPSNQAQAMYVMEEMIMARKVPRGMSLCASWKTRN